MDGQAWAGLQACTTQHVRGPCRGGESADAVTEELQGLLAYEGGSRGASLWGEREGRMGGRGCWGEQGGRMGDRACDRGEGKDSTQVRGLVCVASVLCLVQHCTARYCCALQVP